MVLNLTPDYLAAERKYKQAGSTEEKIAALEEMLSTIPKHKSSEKKQADIKSKIKELRQESQKPKKATGTVDPYHIPPQGGGQVLLVGLPNCGKSSIVGRLTKAPVKITDYPFGTPLPLPGMACYEDAPIELVDLPPVTPEHVPGGLINAVRHTDAVLLVIDLAAPSVLEDIDTLLGLLEAHEIAIDLPGMADDEDDIAVGPRALLVATKADLPEAADNLEVLRELRPDGPELLTISTETGDGLEEMMRRLFEMLDVIRVYAKQPGKPADKEKPFILPIGSTIEELAKQIHKDLAENMTFARVWGSSVHDGQQVTGKHVLGDKDIVEIHE